MSILSTVATIMYTLVAISFIGNFIRLYVESKKLKENKQTPLIGKTIATIIVAALAEVAVILLLTSILSLIGVTGSIITIVLTFGLLYFARVVTAYLVTWGLWAVFVRQAKKKEINKIKQDVQKGASQ